MTREQATALAELIDELAKERIMEAAYAQSGIDDKANAAEFNGNQRKARLAKLLESVHAG